MPDDLLHRDNPEVPRVAEPPKPKIVYRDPPRRAFRPTTEIVGHRNGFPIKAGEPGARDFLSQAFDANTRSGAGRTHSGARKRASRPVRPNAGLQAAYKRKLEELVRAMSDATTRALRAAYRRNPPAMAMDAKPHITARKAKTGTKEYWQGYVNGVPLRNKQGQNRRFETEAAARKAATTATAAAAVIGTSISQASKTPAAEMQAAVDRMAAVWETKFNDAAPKLAQWFLQSVDSRSTVVLKKILRDGGISVKFQITPEMQDVMQATIQENVSLIRSIPSQYFGQIETLVMQSVTAGRDIGFLTKALQQRYGVTYRRAALIARDQNNKATSSLMRTRQTAVGIKEGIWMHSHAGREPRPTHLANNGKRFNIQTGWFDPDPKVRAWIWPGQLINCKCVWRPVVEGFS